MRETARRTSHTVARQLCLIICVAVIASGCVSGPRDNVELEAEFDQINDPLEPLNRHIFAINSAADALILRPVSIFYRDWFPPPLQSNLHNLLNWLSSPVILVHDLLQGEWQRAESTLARFVINLHSLGMGDIAADIGKAAHHSEDAGQTLAVWGAGNGGPYLVLPLIGPSNVRDAIGTGIDFFINPLGAAAGAESSVGRSAAGAVDFRSRNMEEIDDLQRTSLDYYAAVRSLYRQRRESEILNGEADDLQQGPGLTFDFDAIEVEGNQARRAPYQPVDEVGCG